MKTFSYLALLLLAFTGCREATLTKSAIQGQAFGTTFTVQYYASPEMAQDFATAMDSIVDAINLSVSTYIPESDISKINRGNDSLVVDKIFIDNFKLSQSVHKKSDGYFDPTVGVLRNAYGFGTDSPIAKIDSLVIDSLMTMVGFDKVRLRDNNTIEKKHPLIYFDFNAVAKGYAVDQVAAHLESYGIDNYVVEIGGEIMASGKNLEKDSYWVAGIEAVDSPIADRQLAARVSLNHKAMASSGNYRKFRIDTATGQRYVHTLNPLNGSAIRSNVTSATVFANSCAAADAYATSFMAMGIDKAKNLLAQLPEIEAYLTYLDSKGDTQIFKTTGMDALLLE